MFCLEQEPDPFRYIDIPLIFSMVMMPKFGADLVNNAMKSRELKEFLKSNEKFDVCIMELITGDALLVSGIFMPKYYTKLQKSKEILNIPTKSSHFYSELE